MAGAGILTWAGITAGDAHRPVRSPAPHLAAALPAVPFLRALGAGDEETAMRLGLLSLLEEDVALADYVLGAGGEVRRQLRTLLDRIRAEYGP